MLSLICIIPSYIASPVVFRKTPLLCQHSSNNGVESQVTVLGYSGKSIAMANSLVHETNSKGYDNPIESCPVSENPPLNTDLDNLKGSKHAKPESKEELADQAQTHLNKKEQELNDLRHAKAELEGKVRELNESKNLSEADLHKKGQEFDEIRKLWKEACIKLNNLKVKGQGFCAVTDSMLIQKATQLRFNIRNFADQQFGGEFIDAKNFQSFQKTINKDFGISSDSLEACMKNPLGPPLIVGAVLWKILVADVFDNFCWAGTRVSKAMHRLGKVLGKESLVYLF